MPAYVETMAYSKRSGVPWHGLGVEVNNDMTPEEMLVAASLDWSVSKRPLYFPKRGKRTELRIVPDEFALVRDSDETVLDTVGLYYKPVQNREVFDFFTRFVRAGDMSMETAGSLKNGRFVWALARFSDQFKVGGSKNDVVRGYMLLSQPHQFGFSMTAATTPVCVVCWNTLNLALGSGLDGAGGRNTSSFRMPHQTEFNDVVKAAAEQALGLASADMKAFSHTAELLASRAANDTDVLDYFYDVTSVARPEATAENDNEEPRRFPDGKFMSKIDRELADTSSRAIKRLFDAYKTAPGQQLDSRSGTWWGAANAVTYTADHLMSGNDADQRLVSAWYGRGAMLKRRAFELATERIAA